MPVSLENPARARRAGALLNAFFLLLAVSLFLSSCAVNPVTGRPELMFVSEAEEVEIGRRVYPDALWSSLGGGGEFRDPELKAYLGGIVKDLHRASHRPGLPVDFAVQNSSVPNAWAIPGHVVMTRGLLAGLGSEAEFAFVMGHEIGHVSARHTARQMTYKMIQVVGLAAAGVALQDREYAGGALALGAVGSELILLKFSRSDELESDRLGVEYMAKLGYDTENAAAAHRSLEKTVNEHMESLGKNTRERSFFEDLLSTHPRTSVRISEIEEMQREVSPEGKRGDGTNRERFLKMTAGLRKTNLVYREYYDKGVKAYGEKNYDRADKLAARAVEVDPTEPPFHVLRGYVRLARKDYTGAEGFLRKALALDPGYEPALRGMGTLQYLQGKYSGATETLTRAVKIFPGDISARYFLGMGYYKKGDYALAAPNLRAYAEADPGDATIHFYLGSSYEKTGELRAAYNEYLAQLDAGPGTRESEIAEERIRELWPKLDHKGMQEMQRGQGIYR